MKIQKNDIKETLKSVMREESDYQKFFKKSLKAAGKSIPDMTDSEKKAFFNKIDNAWQAKGEKKENESFRGKFGVSEAKATPHLTDSEQQKIAKAIEKATGVSTDYEITDTRYNTGASDFGLDGGQESLLFVGKDDDGFNISVEVDGRQLGSEQAKNFNGAMKSAMKLAKKFKKQLTTETFSNKNESATKAIDLLLKNKGVKDAIKNDKVKVIRKALEDEGFNTKGISDKDILTLAKNLQNESINEATDKKTLELIHTGLGKPKSMPNPVNIYRKWESIKKKHKLNDDALGDYFNTYFKKEYDMARKFYMSNESVNEAAFTKAQIDTLKSAYGGIKTINPNSPSYKKLIKKLDSMSNDELKSLANANIKFVSLLAKNRLNESVVNESLKFDLIDPKTDRVVAFQYIDRPKKEAEKIEQKLNKKLSSTAKSRGYYWTTASIGESVVNEGNPKINKFDNVRSKSKNQAGIVFSIKGNNAVIQTPKGLIKTTIDDLELMPESVVNEASKADTIRKSMPGYVGPKFAKKASDEDILAMADLKDEKAKIHNRYMKSIDDKIKKLQKKYKVNESVNELVNEENTRFNKWLLKFIDNYMKGSEKPGTPEYQWIIKTLFQHTLHDANFHSEAKKVEKIFRRAKEPNKAEQLDGLLLNKAEDIAAKAKWDGYDIIDGFAYVASMRIGGPKLDPIKALKNESVVNENFSKEDIEKLRDVVLDAKGAQNIGKELKKAGFKYDFLTEPIPLYMIKKGSKKFVLVNKRYAEKPDFVVYGIAGGLLGS